MDKHKTFISFHSDDEWAKIELENMNELKEIFINKSVKDGDIDDDLPDDEIRRIIRKDFLEDSTVTILLVGQETKNRKFIDWELHASMINTENHRCSAILCINLPSIKQCLRVGENIEKDLLSKKYDWERIITRGELETRFPYMPSRIIDNFVKGIKISVIEWDEVSKNPSKLQNFIDIAFKRRDSLEYDTHAPLRRKNS